MHPFVLPGNQRYVSNACCHEQQLTSVMIGKSLEEMAEVFGDQIDTQEVLAKHGDTRLVHETDSDHKSDKLTEKADYP